METNSKKEADMRKKIAWLNAGTAVLVCLILLFSWLFAKHLFDYARERVNYYLYETYLSGFGSGFGRQPPRPQSPSQEGNLSFAAPRQRPAQTQTAYEFKANINPALLGAHGVMIFVCWLGTYWLGSQKRKYRGSKLYSDYA